MKALSISPEYACAIFCGEKTVECRTWSTNYRGDILICSTAKKIKGTIPGHALCVATIKDVVPMEKKHLKAACMRNAEYNPSSYAWILDNIRFIRPFAVKGKLSLWNCDHAVEIIEPGSPEDDEALGNLYESLFV